MNKQKHGCFFSPRLIKTVAGWLLQTQNHLAFQIWPCFCNHEAMPSPGRTTPECQMQLGSCVTAFGQAAVIFLLQQMADWERDEGGGGGNGGEEKVTGARGEELQRVWSKDRMETLKTREGEWCSNLQHIWQDFNSAQPPSCLCWLFNTHTQTRTHRVSHVDMQIPLCTQQTHVSGTTQVEFDTHPTQTHIIRTDTQADIYGGPKLPMTGTRREEIRNDSTEKHQNKYFFKKLLKFIDLF